MYSTCLYCHGALGANEDVSSFPVGQRLAVDAAKGRLWVVCSRCARWNLSPLEERWEAIEDCERLYRDTRLRVATDNVGLARLPSGFEVVRIGRPQRPELAAWRYGPQLLSRRRRALPLIAARHFRDMYRRSNLMDPATFLTTQVITSVIHPALLVASVPAYLIGRHLHRQQRLTVLWEGERAVTVRRRHLAGLRLQAAEHDGEGWQLRVPHDDGAAALTGDRALGVLGRLLVHANDVGGTRRDVDLAVKKLEFFRTPEAMLGFAAKRDRLGEPLMRLGYTQRLAVEMAAHEDSERRALEGELSVLEAAWREAEVLAAIADQLLLPPRVEEALERLRRSASPLAASEAPIRRETPSSQGDV